MSKYVIRLLLIFVISYPAFIKAQLYAPGAAFSEDADYISQNTTDSIYIFNVPEYGGSIYCNLEALSPDSTDNWQFIWSLYDTLSGNFNLLGTITGSSSAIDTIDMSGCYQVIISKGAITDTFRAWVFINDFNVEIIDKDDSGKIPFKYLSCEYLDIEAEITQATLRYYIPGRIDTILYVFNSYEDIDWTTENEEGSGSKPGSRLDPRIGDPPYEDTEYIITVTDRFGLERSDNVFYESIISKAQFDNTYISLADEKYYPEDYELFYGGKYEQEQKRTAPAKYKFFDNDSKNAVIYSINFGNEEDTTFYNKEDTIIYEFLYPGEYTVTYFTKSAEPQGCPDSVTMEVVIEPPGMGDYRSGSPEAEPPILPNVFTPNLDGYGDVLSLYKEGNSNDAIANDLFRPVDVSIYNIDIVIFNRYGRKVHEYYGNIRDWKGWDGKIMNSDRNASEGVYFYVVKRIVAVEDWEDLKLKDYSTKIKRGFIHLFRESQN